MSGAFAEWQPRYAEQGIATFPVRDKKPCVRGWQNVNLNGSFQLATRFPEAEAFGFQCGKSSRITLLDIDSSEERVVESGQYAGAYACAPFGKASSARLPPMLHRM